MTDELERCSLCFDDVENTCPGCGQCSACCGRKLSWSRYVDAALRTAPDQPPEDQLVQGALGLCAEVGEFGCDPTADEAGDIAWYLALLADANESLSKIKGLPHPSTAERAQQLDVAAPIIANAVESFAFQDDGFMSHDYTLVVQISRALLELRDICNERFDGFRAVLAANLDKLHDRHPDGAPAATQNEEDDDE